MFYRCKNCGGNVTYDPVKQKMICDNCGGEETQQVIEQKEIHICNNCGAPLEVTEETLSCRCPYCQTHIILEDRMEDEYRPDLVLPFCLDKHQAAEKLQETFQKKMFLPSRFLSAASLESMEGIYVPFWMYDFHSHIHFEGEGDKIRTWTEGDYECTETSIYHLVRDFEVEYSRIPVDASLDRDDSLMDLMEPYDYKALGEFTPEKLSGFSAEIWQESKEQLLPRAEQKADGFSESYLSGYNSHYAAVRTFTDQKDNTIRDMNYAFLPVWRYVYRFGGKNYEFYVNGQTGKVSGSAPISAGRAFGLSAGLFASVCFFVNMLIYLLEVL